jgi:hypothetical protein
MAFQDAMRYAIHIICTTIREPRIGQREEQRALSA